MSKTAKAEVTVVFAVFPAGTVTVNRIISVPAVVVPRRSRTVAVAPEVVASKHRNVPLNQNSIASSSDATKMKLVRVHATISVGSVLEADPLCR